MTLLAQWVEWTVVAWYSSLLRAVSIGGIAIVLFWVIDQSCRSMRPVHRSWLWRALHVKIALLLVCSGSLFTLPSIHVWSGNTKKEAVVGFELSRLAARDSFVEASALVRETSEIVDAKLDERNAIEQDSSESDLAAVGGLEVGTKYLLALLFAWSIGAVGCVVFVFSRHVGLIRTLRKAEVPVDRQTDTVFRKLVKDLEIQNPPRLLLVRLDCSPCLVWDGQSCIVLPADFANRFGKEACRIAIAHELGHFVRRDLLWNCLATVVSAWLFFFPLVWLMNRRYRIALEMACDAFTIDRARIDRLSYANLLLGLLDSRSRWQASTTSVAMAGSGSFRSLSTRLNAMKFQKQGHFWMRRFSLGAAICVAGASLLPWGFADDDDTKPKKTTASSSASSDVRTSVGSSNSVEVTSETASTGSKAKQTTRQRESISKTVNNVDGKQSMSVDVSSNTQTIRIREDSEGTFRVDIEDKQEGNYERKFYAAVSRKKFIADHPEVYARIKSYLEESTPVAPVAPRAPIAPNVPVAPKARKPAVVAGVPIQPGDDGLSDTSIRVTGVPLVQTVPGFPIAPTVQTVPGFPIAPAVKTVPGFPITPAVPGVVSVTGVPLKPQLSEMLASVEQFENERVVPLRTELERLKDQSLGDSHPSVIAAKTRLTGYEDELARRKNECMRAHEGQVSRNEPVPTTPPARHALVGVIEALEKIRLESAGNAEVERLIESIKSKLDVRPHDAK